jgi:hypothetical protein
MAKKQSKKWKLNKYDWNEWFKSALRWLAPLGIIYFGSVAVAINTNGFEVSDFYLTPVTSGAIALYIVNRFYDLSLRLKQS